MKRRFWTQAEDDIVRRTYPSTPTAQIAKALGRTLSQVYQRALGMGVHKSPAYLASPAACRLRRGDNVGAAHRFQKGFVPHNKGKPHPTRGRAAETQFKKGQLTGRAAQIVQPIGAERLSKEGIRQRKVNNGMPFQGRWKAVHAIVWEEHNGPIPAGQIVVFKDRNRANIVIENLELITFAENMRRNTLHRYPKEIALAIQAVGALNRQINKRAKVNEKQN